MSDRKQPIGSRAFGRKLGHKYNSATGSCSSGSASSRTYPFADFKIVQLQNMISDMEKV